MSITHPTSFSSNTNKYRTAGEFVIVMGSTYLKSSDANTLQYYVQEVIVHPLFHYDTLNNDIALMFINGYIPWQAKAVKALALQTGDLAVSTSCVVTGWGVLSDVSIFVCLFVYRLARLPVIIPAIHRKEGFLTLLQLKMCISKTQKEASTNPQSIGLLREYES